jgi:hypothetical protein
MDKTQIIPITTADYTNFIRRLRRRKKIALEECLIFDPRADTFKYLGVPMGNEKLMDKIREPYWQEIKTKIEQKLNSLALYRVPLAAQVYVINTFVLSKLVYLDPFYNAPKKVLSQVRDLVQHKLRNGRRRLPVNYATLCQPLTVGGIGLHDVVNKVVTPRAKRIYLLLTRPTFAREYILSHQQSEAISQ